MNCLKKDVFWVVVIILNGVVGYLLSEKDLKKKCCGLIMLSRLIWV